MYRIQFLVSDQKYLLPDIRWDIRLKPEIETVSVIYILLHYIPVLCVTHTHTRLTALFPGLPGWAGTRTVKPIWILLKQETVSSSGISRALCKSAPRSRQITMPAPHHSVFYRPDALPATQPVLCVSWLQLFQCTVAVHIVVIMKAENFVKASCLWIQPDIHAVLPCVHSSHYIHVHLHHSRFYRWEIVLYFISACGTTCDASVVHIFLLLCQRIVNLW